MSAPADEGAGPALRLTLEDCEANAHHFIRGRGVYYIGSGTFVAYDHRRRLVASLSLVGEPPAAALEAAADRLWDLLDLLDP